MGAWGTGSFDNDDAWEWVSELEQVESLDLILESLDVARPGGPIPDAIDGALCIVAAETVAAWCGRPSPGLPEEITEWVARQPRAPEGVRERALLGIHQVATESALREMWQRAGLLAEWIAHVTALQRRLLAG